MGPLARPRIENPSGVQAGSPGSARNERHPGFTAPEIYSPRLRRGGEGPGVRRPPNDSPPDPQPSASCGSETGGPGPGAPDHRAEPDEPVRPAGPAPTKTNPTHSPPGGVRAASFCSGYGARACAPGPPQNCPHSLPPPRQSHLWRSVLRARPTGSPRLPRATAWRCALLARSEKAPGHFAPTTRSVPSEVRPRAPDWASLRSGLS